jgi:hypothetical protein
MIVDRNCYQLAECYLPSEVPECRALAIDIQHFIEEWMDRESAKAAKAEVAKLMRAKP